MSIALMEKIAEGTFVRLSGNSYKVLGKAIYSTRNDPESKYAKMLLEGHHVLVIAPDEMAYFGINKGHLSEFDSFEKIVEYDGKKLKQTNADYQIRISLEFGSPSEVEGNVLFWDYEPIDDSDDGLIISVGEDESTKERADVVARFIEFDEIEVY